MKASEVTLAALDVKKYLPYAEEFFRGRISAGHVEARVPYTGLFGGGAGHETVAEKHRSKADQQALGLATPQLMEELLAAKIAVTGEEFRQLMTARAGWVQGALLQDGQVAADRLLLIAPKPVDATYRGESRVNLSLN
jgi:hypothetical protein